MNDSSPEVQIELAAAVAEALGDDDAVALLSLHITGGEPLLAHQALCRVLYMPGIAARFTQAVQTAAERYREHEEWIWFPVRQAADMYQYLYAGSPLCYEEDLQYFNAEERTRPW